MKSPTDLTTIKNLLNQVDDDGEIQPPTKSTGRIFGRGDFRQKPLFQNEID